MPQNPLVAFVAKFGSSFVALKADSTGALVTANPGVAPSYAGAATGLIGTAANQSGATTSAGLATTYTGLCLSNPAGSGQNLSLLRVSGVCNVAPAALTAVGLIVGYVAGGITVHTTPVTPLSSKIGSAAPALVGLVDAACTLVGTPAWARWFAETIATTGEYSFDENVGGEILIPPGGYAAIVTTIAGPTAGLLASFTWQEV